MSIRIGVEGMGQMGLYYLSALFKLGFDMSRVIVWDIVADRMAAAQEKHPMARMARSVEDFAAHADAFILAVSTPAHHTEIERLVSLGARKILCEKPLAQDGAGVREVQNIAHAYPNLDLRTAFVIGFSPVRTHLVQLVQREGLVLRTFGGRWGKNRGRSTEMRPTPGDRVDEFVHMIEFGLGLVPSVQYVDVTAQVGHLAYANADSQRKAHEHDASFPLKPDHSTQALLSVRSNAGETHMALSSSFLEARQVRQVWGTFACGMTTEPAYAFAVDFDVAGADVLTLTHIRSDKVSEQTFRCDKLAALTSSFVRLATNDEEDERLATVAQAGFLVDIMEAVGESDRMRKEGRPRCVRVSPSGALGPRAVA